MFPYFSPNVASLGISVLHYTSVSVSDDCVCVCATIQSYIISLLLTDKPLLSTKVSVTVNVLDVNEFPPELAVPSESFVCENSRIGQVS